jgi:hypothetical protein
MKRTFAPRRPYERHTNLGPGIETGQTQSRNALGGREKAQARFDAGEIRVNAWLGAKATPRASRVATFIVLWAAAMHEEGRDEYSITEYQRRWNENERKAYRLQREFRELWPEYETPNELARQVVKYLDEKRPTNFAALPTQVSVTA